MGKTVKIRGFWARVCVAASAVALVFSATNAWAARATNGVRVMSFNIHVANNKDDETNWDRRKETLVDVIKESDPDLLGVQEALPRQMDYLNETLTEYASFGVGRTDGKRKGEFTAIFYKKDKFELLDSGTFWLSPTPEKPGRGWDASYTRILTWGKFRSLKTKKEFVYANTHLDNAGKVARLESAKMILSKFGEMVGDKAPFFVTGDFNCDENSEPYRLLTTSGLYDAGKIAKTCKIAQPRTFNNYCRIPVEKGKIIDFVFVNSKCDVLKFEINPDLHRDPKTRKKRPASDHNSIVATLRFVD
ncbi:MAG: endonuclease/exonuclease/phosphatase family protein [Thermoguttaceae bacterium]|nr:endonuclease/exonuclease/phosphatase family protein [Thermoguttaceae bacterium]